MRRKEEGQRGREKGKGREKGERSKEHGRERLFKVFKLSKVCQNKV